MPLGTFEAIALNKQPKPEKRPKPEKPPKPEKQPKEIIPEQMSNEPETPIDNFMPNQSLYLADLSILLVAPTVAEAEDFMCSLYFEAGRVLTQNGISVYIKDYQSINRMISAKRMLDISCSKRVGTEVVRGESSGLSGSTVFIGPSGQQSKSAALHFFCATPQNMSSHNLIWALVNLQNTADARSFISSVRSAAGGRRVLWILMGGESVSPIFTDDPRDIRQIGMKKLSAGISDLLNGEIAIWAQVYGGLILSRHESGSTVLITHQKCREYIPHGCILPLQTAFRTSLDNAESEAEKNAFSNLLAGFGDWINCYDLWVMH